MTRYLFIGGTADGLTLETGGDPVWCVASSRGNGFCISKEEYLRHGFCISKEEYLRHDFCFDDQRHTVYMLKGLRPSLLFDILLNGYRKTP